MVTLAYIIQKQLTSLFASASGDVTRSYLGPFDLVRNLRHKNEFSWLSGPYRSPPLPRSGDPIVQAERLEGAVEWHQPRAVVRAGAGLRRRVCIGGDGDGGESWR
jgi:hypothetical protein